MKREYKGLSFGCLFDNSLLFPELNSLTENSKMESSVKPFILSWRCHHNSHYYSILIQQHSGVLQQAAGGWSQHDTQNGLDHCLARKIILLAVCMITYTMIHIDPNIQTDNKRIRIHYDGRSLFLNII